MKIFALVAGKNDPSNSDALADAFMQGTEKAGATTVQKRRLRDMQIEHFSLDHYDPQCKAEEDFCELQHLLEGADGFVFATPVWNFSVPANLKNFIDRMGSFALNETRSKGTLGGKPFYLIFTGGAPVPAWLGLMKKTTSHVQEALRYFGATHIGSHFEEKCTKGVGKFGLVVDQRPNSLANVREQGYAFGLVVKEFAATGKLPAGQTLMRKVYGWGQAVMKKL